MKKLLLILLCAPMIGVGQDFNPNYWHSSTTGNAFDGFSRMAAIMTNENDFFGVVNSSSYVSLDCGESFYGVEENNFLQNNASIRLLTIPGFEPSEVLVSFDDEREYYIAVFSITNSFIDGADRYMFDISELISKDYNSLYLKHFILDKLKQHTTINFRVSKNSLKHDVSFSLSGSTKAINNTVRYPKCLSDIGSVRYVLTMMSVFNDMKSQLKNKPYYLDKENLIEAIGANLGFNHPYAKRYTSYKYVDIPPYTISFFNEEDEKVAEMNYRLPQKFNNRENALKFGFKLFNEHTEEDYEYEEYLSHLNSDGIQEWLYEAFVSEGYNNKFADFRKKLLNISTKIGNLEVMSEDFVNDEAKIFSAEEAKKVCADLGDGWRLPTKEELNVLYENKDEIGGFANTYYWSSPEDDGNYWGMHFGDGSWSGDGSIRSSSPSYVVRAVRNF